VNGLFDPEWSFQEDANALVNPARKAAEKRLAAVANKVMRAEALDESGLMEGLDPGTRFYVLGLAPNVSRIAVRFFHTDAFQATVHKMMQHYADLQINKEFESQPGLISIRQILKETVSQKANDPEPAPLLGGAVMRAILDNRPYPEALYTSILNRIRVDMDDDKRKVKKINYVRAAVIKACLIRKYRNRNQDQIMEVLCMSLNEQSTNRAYLLGRLFAVLEKAQKDAIGDANSTITDRYFTSACATPAAVFPVLLRLSRHHISKAEFGGILDRRIGDIMGLLEIDNNPFPARLSLDEQGLFVLGFYHQRAANYAKTKSVTQEP
jgi:CRISPR-associated protein Csd1